MKTHQLRIYPQLLIYVALALLSACNTANQPITKAAENSPGHIAQNPPMPAITPDPASKAVQPTLQRVMARLNGLSGEQDMRLSKLKERTATLPGISLLTLGIMPSGQAASQPSQQFSALMVFQIDPARVSLPDALLKIQALETFAYVEADQALQKR
jgi:hypothetical protein